MTGFTADFVAGVPSWGARIAYGPTTLIGGVEVLPVALVAFGFGAGVIDRSASNGPTGPSILLVARRSRIG